MQPSGSAAHHLSEGRGSGNTNIVKLFLLTRVQPSGSASHHLSEGRGSGNTNIVKLFLLTRVQPSGSASHHLSEGRGSGNTNIVKLFLLTRVQPSGSASHYFILEEKLKILRFFSSPYWYGGEVRFTAQAKHAESILLPVHLFAETPST